MTSLSVDHFSEAVLRHVYVHVPFCTHICPYCSFYKIKNLSGPMNLFLPGLRREVEEMLDAGLLIQPETIFFGGGTPSALSLSQFRDLEQWWPWREVAEWTLEANPLTISAAKADALRSLGINRVSLGVQAFDETCLKLLGRTHRAPDIVSSMATLRGAGFNNINIDLMFALPGQSLEVWSASLDAALALEPEHVSLYELTYEEDTAFFDLLNQGKMHRESTGEAMHWLAIERLEAAGFIHYEVSNFAKPGREAEHNRATWRGLDYIGFGPGACSTIANRRWRNVPDINAWANDPHCREVEVIDPETRRRERIMLGLRTAEGIPESILAGQEPLIQEMESLGWLRRFDGSIIPTSRGRLLADAIAEELL